MFTSSTAHDNHASVQLAKDGVSFSLSTDDPGVMLCDLNGEYVVAEENIGLTYDQLKLSVSGLCMDVCTAVSVDWYERDKDVVKTSVYLTPTPHTHTHTCHTHTHTTHPHPHMSHHTPTPTHTGAGWS